MPYTLTSLLSLSTAGKLYVRMAGRLELHRLVPVHPSGDNHTWVGSGGATTPQSVVDIFSMLDTGTGGRSVLSLVDRQELYICPLLLVD